MMLILLGMVSGAGVHYLTLDRERIHESLSALAHTTVRTGLSLSVGYDTPDSLNVLLPAVHPAYPEMQVCDRMDFVYER